MQAAEHTLCKLVILLCDDFYSDFTFILKKFLYFSIIDELTVDRDRKYKEKTCNKGSFQLSPHIYILLPLCPLICHSLSIMFSVKSKDSFSIPLHHIVQKSAQ